MVGTKQRIVRDCLLWAADAKSRLLIVPRGDGARFQLSIGSTGTVERQPGLPARDTTFGTALAAKRLRDHAVMAVPDFDKAVLSCTSFA